MNPLLTRRRFISASLASAALAACRAASRGALYSGFEDARGDQFVGGLSLDDGRVFGVRAPLRTHGCAIDPRDANRVIFFARRPGTQAFELSRDSLQVRSVLTTPEGRHLAGHGVVSADGAHVLTPEHDYARVRGVIAVRDARTFAIVSEIDTRGIDPHEIAWLPDGRSLLVANGGILTHPRSYRAKLNIGTMDPSLCVIDSMSGECLDQQRLPDHKLSIRHLAVAADGSAAIGLQYEGVREQAPGVVALYRRGAGLQLLAAPDETKKQFNGYVASVAVSGAHDLIAAACPYGAGVACWSLREQRYLGIVPAQEAYGLSRLADGAVMASQRDGAVFTVDEHRRRSQFAKVTGFGAIRWDDHWQFSA